MKLRSIVMLVLIVSMLLIGSISAVSAAPGGVPAAHGVSGQEWGAAVSSAAPGGFIGCHASGGQAATCP